MNGDHKENEEWERNTLKSKESVKIQKKNPGEWFTGTMEMK